jgi:hypothetical protein
VHFSEIAESSAGQGFACTVVVILVCYIIMPGYHSRLWVHGFVAVRVLSAGVHLILCVWDEGLM